MQKRRTNDEISAHPKLNRQQAERHPDQIHRQVDDHKEDDDGDSEEPKNRSDPPVLLTTRPRRLALGETDHGLDNESEAEQADERAGGKAQGPIPLPEQPKTDEPGHDEAKRANQRTSDELLPLVHTTGKKALPDPLSRTWQL